MLEGGYFLIWNEGEGPAREHALRETTEERAYLRMQVAQHFIGAPAADEAYDISVNAGAEEGIGSRGSEATGCDILGKETKRWAQEPDGQLDGVSDHAGFDSDSGAIRAAAVGKWSILRKEIGPEVQDSAGYGADGAKQGVSTGAMTNDLTSDAIFLFIKGEGCEGGGQ